MTNLLSIAMQAAIPLRIMQLQLAGGPSEQDISAAQETSDLLDEKGETLLFGGKKGEVADIFNRTAAAVAVLAFCPGGVYIFGTHFEAGQLERDDQATKVHERCPGGKPDPL